MQNNTANANDLVAHYIARGGSIKQGKTRRARGISYFALSLKGTKHQGKENYVRGNRRAR